MPNLYAPTCRQGEIVELMRQRQKAQVTGFLEIGDLRAWKTFPIIPMAVTFLIKPYSPRTFFWKLGPSISFRSPLDGGTCMNARPLTVSEMIGFAKENFAKFDSRKQITPCRRRAVDVLLHWQKHMILSLWIRPKSYIVLPEILKHLGLVGSGLGWYFQGGDVCQGHHGSPPWSTNHLSRGLQKTFHDFGQSGLTATLVPRGRHSHATNLAPVELPERMIFRKNLRNYSKIDKHAP